jgi:hypothetical protein
MVDCDYGLLRALSCARGAGSSDLPKRDDLTFCLLLLRYEYNIGEVGALEQVNIETHCNLYLPENRIIQPPRITKSAPAPILI